MFEWFALAGMALAIILAVLIGAALALIVEGNAASMEIRDERGHSDTDGKQDAAGDGNKARPQTSGR
jgi:hypothetical protein